ncbi:hypothetical protein IE53DRAFT_253595 [Violaceomyces palustris]|uniref:Uncharacterized protein n=1 Tax=Violaceomyces palustris TaxID=1673888 RepID=A0ACD0P434_9BASI|nr:hypothetical protein IE53DRAFT_253595 [Violaceomyces palustris]
MAARQRKERALPAGSEELQLWHNVRTHLRSLERIRSSAQQHFLQIEQIRTKLVAMSKEDPEVRKKPDFKIKKQDLESHYSQLRTKVVEEQAAIDAALEKLGILSALRSAPPDHHLLDGGGSKRKKRRTEASSPTPSSLSPSSQNAAAAAAMLPRSRSPDSLHLPSSLADSTTSSSSSSSRADLASTSALYSSRKDSSHQVGGSSVVKAKGPGGSGRRGTASNSSSSAAGATSKDSSKDPLGSSQNSSSAYSSSIHMDPAKARREALAHQLPLQKGRKVAFRQPVKKTGAAAGAAVSLANGLAPNGLLPGEEEGETWIMATVIECINNDRNRYVVQDAEDEGGAGPQWNTTLKAIVPLPESVATLPPQDYPVGAQVMGLYPDTSCFYRATVKGGGPGITKNTPMSKLLKKEQELLNANYELMFEDDGAEIRLVPAYLVVERPRA